MALSWPRLPRIAGYGRSEIPFEMFDLPRVADEAKRAHKLANIYHRGQELAWDGREVLSELIAKHGGSIQIDPARRDDHGVPAHRAWYGRTAATVYQHR